MTRPAYEAKESHKGFQPGADRLFAVRRSRAYLTDRGRDRVDGSRHGGGAALNL